MRKSGEAGKWTWTFPIVFALALQGGHAAVARADSSPPATPTESDYSKRIVAYFNGKDTITRQELGEYLIDRVGAEKLELLVNRRIIDRACRAHGIEVTGAEVEASLVEDLKGLNIDRARFVRDVLKSYRKNLYEWKEDIIRPKLLLTKLTRNQVTVTEDEVNEAFDAKYGEKIDARIILWPKSQEEEAKREYATLRDSEEAFAVKAKQQWRSNLAATGGKIKPVVRGGLGLEEVEREAFKLKPGEVTRLLQTPEGILILKCDRRLPADTSVNLAKVRPELEREVREKKLLKQLPSAFAELRKAAAPKTSLPTPGSAEDTPASRRPDAAVATLADGEVITREQLGEFLIARYGAEKLDLLVNRRILDAACAARNLTCDDAEIEVELEVHLRRYNADRKHFVEQVLKPNRVTLHEWREDVARTKILLEKLCRHDIVATDEDLRQAFDSYYGEKVRCRLILYPKGEERAAMLDYPKIRESEKEFAHKARTQASPQLAAKGGNLGPLARHTTGNPDLEKEAFELQPGQVSRLIGTPEGIVVLKCDGREPARSDVKLETVKAELVKEVIDRKLPHEMNRVFQEMRKAAQPRLLLRDPNAIEDLASQIEAELQPLPGEQKK